MNEEDRFVVEMTYPACLREMYTGEVLGEAFAHALMLVAKNDRERYHFAVLMQLETETKARLRPVLYAYGLTLEQTADLTQIDAVVSAYKTMEYREFAELLRPRIEWFINRYEAIAKLAPESERETALSMVRHERAILSWLEQESNGATSSSLDDMLAELKWPISDHA